MASGTYYPAASADDGYTLAVNFYYPSADYLDFGNKGNQDLNAAYIRFATVAIPQGVTITSAFVRLTAYATNSTDPVNVNCHFEDVDDATQVTSAAEYRGRSLTAAVAWNSVAAWTDGTTYDTPSLITILQAIVDRVGWVENNDLLFSLENNGTSFTDYRQASAIDYVAGAEKAELHVEWTDPNVTVSATTATLTITPNAATVIGAAGVYPSTIALTITPNVATVAFGIPVAATCASLTITPNAATVSYDVVALASVASLTITPNTATISWDLDISAALAELTIATHDATIWEGATWAAWIAANGDKVVIKYYFTLTGDGETPVVDDVEIPIPSFQCRRRSGSPTYLSVVIRGTDYADEVNARSNGDLKVEMAYELYGSEIYRETVAIVDLEDIQVDEGSSSASIVLTGHRTIAYTPKQITLRDIVYYQLKDGKYRFRCSIPNLYLAPGDTAIGDGNEFTVDDIQYIVSPELQMMEVKET